MRDAMETQYANVHRGLHWMSERTTDAYEAARDAVARLLNARRPARDRVHPQQHRGDQPGGAQLRPRRAAARPGGADLGDGAPLQHRALADAARRRAASSCASRRSPMPASSTWPRSRRCWPTARSAWWRSPTCPTCSAPTRRRERIVQLAHAHGAKVLFDGAQAMVHRRVDVQALGCDFYAFTGHKLYGPTGIGVLWGRRELLEAMPPFLGGGEMISSVSYERSTWAAGAAQVRGRHAADPGRHRPEGGDRLRAGDRLRRRSPRTRRR